MMLNISGPYDGPGQTPQNFYTGMTRMADGFQQPQLNSDIGRNNGRMNEELSNFINAATGGDYYDDSELGGGGAEVFLRAMFGDGVEDQLEADPALYNAPANSVDTFMQAWGL